MFYDFRQNNSGGRWKHNLEKGIGHSVIVEARDYEHANERARAIGLYFQGCAIGSDCSCCGDRWTQQYSFDEGTDVPSIYGQPLETLIAEEITDNNLIFVHYLDGRIERKGNPVILEEDLTA
jgi:hypothetical protein